ncbi:MAG: FAD-binding protein [Planctomycetaceae bacterium]|nr:FAD-binding protein [Planctomycetaceae bacterium]
MPSLNREIVNFGGNVRFRPTHYYEPRTEAEVLDILRTHAHGQIRVAAALHSWSNLLVSDDAVVCLRHFRDITTRVDAAGDTWVTIGAGCRVKHALKALRPLGLTLPAIGLITEQFVAGAIATGTHGSGNHGLGHYVQEVRIAAYDGQTGEPGIFTISSGDELRAARCHLGCLGIILSVTLKARPEYHVGERNARYKQLDDVVARESQQPLQHFFLVPHQWEFVAQHRCIVPPVTGPLYRFDRWAYFAGWFVTMDVGLHLTFKLLAGVIRRPSVTRQFFRRVMPYLLIEEKTFVGRSDRVLTWEHELFRHMEIEMFVPRQHLAAAVDHIRAVLTVCDGSEELDPLARERLQRAGLLEPLLAVRGAFTHHYPICVRRVFCDDTLMSMSSGDGHDWYSFSFITLAQPRDGFRKMADYLARSMTQLFGARPHWGKYCPLDGETLRTLYPRWTEFDAVCRRYDPRGVFQNDFTRAALGRQ